MARPDRQKRERSSRQQREPLLPSQTMHEARHIKPSIKEKILTPQNAAQQAYLDSLEVNSLTFAIGPAGTGKTYLSAWTAADMLDEGAIKKIIISRPAIEAGENLGFLPGEMEEKIAPYFVPVREALERRLGAGAVEYYIKSKVIEFVPLAYMRGRTFDDAFVILDEAQNTTPKQMKMFLTRTGRNSRIVVDGDLRQSDIEGDNGLLDAIHRLRHMKHTAVIEFKRADVVRSGLAQMIVDAYEGTDDYEIGERVPDFLLR